jgi:tRNA pseudouridine65 synthase
VEKKMIAVLFQNEDFVAVDKPYGISVHNIEDPVNLLSSLENQLKIKKLYPIHRLDKETSGVQVFALTEAAAKKLSTEFQEKSVIKNYVGILRGKLEQNSGVWLRPLSDKAEGRKNPAGLSKDRIHCETQYRVLESSPYFTYCEFNLITGRQHQIRKHTVLAKHELLGDTRYGDLKYNKKMSTIYETERMFLHCTRLEILKHKIESPVPQCFLRLMT